MGQETSEFDSPQDQAPQTPPGAGELSVAEPGRAPRPQTRPVRFVLKIVLAGCAVLLLSLILLELGLRLAGWSYPTSFCVLQKQDGIYTDNDKFFWPYYGRRTNVRPHPFAVPIVKPPETFRIVLIGESAAAGLPDPAYGLGRVLERLLQAQNPERPIEVINAAMRGVTPQILAAVARDCLRLQPDLAIVYGGNRDGLNLPVAGTNRNRLMTALPRLPFTRLARSTRVAQLLEPFFELLRSGEADNQKKDAAYFEARRIAADDPQQKAAEADLQAGLAEVCRVLSRAHCPVLLSTVVVNLKDCPPFAALHRLGLSPNERSVWEGEFDRGVKAEKEGEFETAASHYTAAAMIDDHFAELHYRLGRCLFALGQFEKAAAAFALARDWDALPLRASSRINQMVRNQAAQTHDSRTVVLVDAEAAFARSELSAKGAPGDQLFYDHAHLTFEGAHLLARTFLPVAQSFVDGKFGPSSRAGAPPLSRGECAKSLAFTRINEAHLAATMVKARMEPPFVGQLEHAQALAEDQKRIQRRFGTFRRSDFEAASTLFEEAIREHPSDWHLPASFARLLYLSRDHAAAIAQFEAARRLLPHSLPIRLGLSNALSAAGRLDDALWQLNEALALDPRSEAVRGGMAAVQALRRTVTTKQ